MRDSYKLSLARVSELFSANPLRNESALADDYARCKSPARIRVLVHDCHDFDKPWCRSYGTTATAVDIMPGCRHHKSRFHAPRDP